MRTTLTLLVVLVVTTPCFATLTQTLALDADGGGGDSGTFGSISGSTFTLLETGLMDNGVTFDVTLSVTGNGTSVAFNNNGLGVDGTTINDGESLTFSIAISNEVGGTVNFDGFTSLDFNSFTVAGDDQGILSVDNSIGSLGDNTTLTGALGEFAISGSPTTFTVFGQPGLVPGGNNTSFQLDDVTAQFTATAVPEPSVFATLVFSLGLIGTRRRRSN